MLPLKEIDQYIRGSGPNEPESLEGAHLVDTEHTFTYLKKSPTCLPGKRAARSVGRARASNQKVPRACKRWEDERGESAGRAAAGSLAALLAESRKRVIKMGSNEF